MDDKLGEKSAQCTKGPAVEKYRGRFLKCLGVQKTFCSTDWLGRRSSGTWQGQEGIGCCHCTERLLSALCKHRSS